MARMSIDDMIVRDPRITKLTGIVGWSRREVVGCLVMDVWPICYDQRESVIASELIDIAAGRDGFAAAMVECGLADWVRGNRKVRIKGAQERIEYLARKRESGRVGGIKSAESRTKNSSTTGSTPQAPGNPPVPDPVPDSAPVPDPVPDHKNSATPTACGSLFGPEPSGTRKRKPKAQDWTADEVDSALFVLDRLAAQSGVRYSGTDEHKRLIIAQLRRGVSELELRGVVGYCAIKLEWADKPDMVSYLRPETLFGPRSISKYLDASRAWVESLPADTRPQPRTKGEP